MSEAQNEWAKVERPDCITFVRSGDGYATFGNNAITVSSQTDLKLKKGSGIESVFIHSDLLRHYTSDLIKKGLSVIKMTLINL